MISKRMNPKLSCSDPDTFEPLVDALASGPMAPEEERKVIQHLQECPSCQEQYREAVRFFLLYRGACPPEGTREQVERIKAGVQRKIRVIRRRQRLAAVVGLAAGIALVVWGPTLMTQPQPEPTVVAENVSTAPPRIEEPEPVPLAPQVVDTGVKEPREPSASETEQEAKTESVKPPEVESNPYAGFKPRAAYGRIWQKTAGLLRPYVNLTEEQRTLLTQHVSYLESLLAKDPLRPSAWNHLRKMHEKLGDLQAANRAFERHIDALKEQGNEGAVVLALVERGGRLLSKGATLEAVKHYSQVLNEYPNAPGSERAWFGIAAYYLKVGDEGNACKYLQHVCENYEFKEGVVRDAFCTLANVMSNSGNYDDAIRITEALLQKSSYVATRAHAELSIGDFYRYQGKSAKAVQAYRGVLAKYKVPSARTGAEYRLARLHQKALAGDLP